MNYGKVRMEVGNVTVDGEYAENYDMQGISKCQDASILFTHLKVTNPVSSSMNIDIYTYLPNMPAINQIFFVP